MIVLVCSWNGMGIGTVFPLQFSIVAPLTPSNRIGSRLGKGTECAPSALTTKLLSS